MVRAAREAMQAARVVAPPVKARDRAIKATAPATKEIKAQARLTKVRAQAAPTNARMTPTAGMTQTIRATRSVVRTPVQWEP